MSRSQELGVQPPVGFWDPAGLSKDGDVEVSVATHSMKCIDPSDVELISQDSARLCSSLFVPVSFAVVRASSCMVGNRKYL